MEVVHPRCCGIDVHKASVCACISIKDHQKSGKQKQRFETTTAGLRELTRARASFAPERSRIISRIEKTLEDPNLKLGVVASDVVGVSGRAMLEAILRGEEDPAKLAELAKGTLRGKIPPLRLALEGKVTAHHRFMLRQWLDMLDFLDGKIAQLEAQIVDKSRPFETTVQTWMQVPGLRRINAYSLLAEIGADMKPFPTAAHLASWAAVCPGNRESAGKQTSGKIRLVMPGCDARCAKRRGQPHGRRSRISVRCIGTWRAAGGRTGR